MTESAGPHGTTSTLPPPSANGARWSPPAPQASVRAQLRARISGMRTASIAGLAALIVMVIFIVQNVHAANISFLGVHLVLPLAGALLLAAIAGSVVTVAAGPARIARLRQAMGRVLPGPGRRADKRPEAPAPFPPVIGQPAPDNKQPARLTD